MVMEGQEQNTRRHYTTPLFASQYELSHIVTACSLRKIKFVLNSGEALPILWV